MPIYNIEIEQGMMVNINIGNGITWIGMYQNKFTKNGVEYYNIITSASRLSTDIDLDNDMAIAVEPTKVSMR